MNAPPAGTAQAHDQFVISHGKSGAVGVFTAPEPLRLERGQRVLVQTARGNEVGSVLCRATLHQARLLGATSSGPLLRPLTSQDETLRQEHTTIAQAIFETSRAWAQRDGLALEILDVELLWGGQDAIVQFVGAEATLDTFAEALQQHFQRTIRLENLAMPAPPPEEESHGCDKPDCGRTGGGGGGCTSCSTGGGCSSCGSGKVDLRAYFGHLREKMPTQRIPLA